MSAAEKQIERSTRDNSSFAEYFNYLFLNLKNWTADPDSIEYIQAVAAMRDYIVEFWKEQSAKQHQLEASFGSDENGDDQPAFGMQILTDTEISICKWGFEIDPSGTKTPKMDIFVSVNARDVFPGLLYNYDISMTQAELVVTRIDWKDPAPKQNKETYRFPLQEVNSV